MVSGGLMEQRYKVNTSVNGVQGALGAVVHLGRFEVRADASLINYGWSFRYDTTDDDKADGGSDLIERIGLSVGYVY